MGSRIARRLVSGAVVAMLGTATVALGSTPALADDHDYITVTGIDLAEPLTAAAADQPELYAELRGEVGWLLDRPGDASEPTAQSLGPQYTMVLHVAGEPRHRFHLYPLAEGGPRVFQPAEQPGKADGAEVWHFGRLSLPETLRAAGVPLTGHPATSGGSGGGRLGAEGSSRPDPGALGFLDQWRKSMLLTTGVALAIMAGVASIAFLLRREPSRPPR